MRERTAVVDLNIARRSDLFASRAGQDRATACGPAELVEFTTTVRYASGREEGPITVRLPRALAGLGPVERGVMVFACSRYAAGAADQHGAVSFTPYDLARWLGWERPNSTQYDRLERAVETVASVRFTRWADYVERVEHPRGRRATYQRVRINSIFGFVDEADIETRERAAARREAEHLPANAERRITFWINRRFREALDTGVSVRLPHDALCRLGLKNRIAAQLYYLIVSKRSGTRDVELSRSVVEQVTRPAAGCRRNLRRRVERACSAIMKADPSWRVRMTDAADGGWKVVAAPSATANSSAFGVAATGIRGSCNAQSGLLQRSFGVAATRYSRKVKETRTRRARDRHRATRAQRA